MWLFLIIIMILYAMYIIWNLIFRYYRIAETDKGSFVIQTLSWLVPFYWHSSMFSDGERTINFDSSDWNDYKTLDAARRGFSRETMDIVAIHSIKEPKRKEDLNWLLEGVTDKDEILVLKSIIKRNNEK